MRLKQVRFHLPGNAINLPERGRVEISVAVQPADAGVAQRCFRVRDTGIGLDPARQAKFFQLFSPGDSSMTRRFG